MHNRKLLKQIFKQPIFSPSTGTEHYFKICDRNILLKHFFIFFSKNE